MPEKIAVVGAGLIGRSWAMVFARAGREVALHDPYPEALDEAERLLDIALADLEDNGLVASAAEVRPRIARAPALEDALDGAAWVQENAPERLEAKRPLFEAMDALAPPETVIASSTSAIPCGEISAGMAGAARMLVAHPANPPYLLPIVELSGAPATAPDTIARARAFMEDIGMAPVVIRKEMRGFVLNRLQVALLAEAFKLVEDGAISAEDLDKTVKHGLGLRWSFMGPMETIDLNAPGGIRDYLGRFGPAFGEIAREQSEHRAWDDARYARLEAERRETAAPEDLPGRAMWRDRRLMALLRHKREADGTYGT